MIMWSDLMPVRQHLQRIALTLLVVLVLPACQSSDSTPATVTPKPEGTVSLEPAFTAITTSKLGVDQSALRGVKVEVWHALFGSSAALFGSQLAEFNTENPWGIIVHAAQQGNYTTLFDKVVLALKDFSPPDIIMALPEQVIVFGEAGAVVDLSPYVHDPVWGMREAELSDFPNAFLAQEKIGDQWWGMPAQRSARFLFYNQTWARELGFDSQPVTPEEFKEQVCAANQAMRSDTDPNNDGKGGWIVDTDSKTVLSWMMAFDGGPLQNGNYRFLAPNNIAAFKYLKEMYDENCSWLSSEVTPYEQFASRLALFVTGSLEDLPAQVRAFNQVGNLDEWTVMAFPGNGGSSFMLYGSSYSLLGSSDENQLASWLFIRWMLSPDNQARWVLSTGLFPLRVSSMVSLANYRIEHPQWRAAVDLIPQGLLQPQLVSWRKVHPIFGDGVSFIFRTDMTSGSVPAVLAQMDRIASELSQ